LVPRVIVAQPDKAMTDNATIATNFNFMLPPKKNQAKQDTSDRNTYRKPQSFFSFALPTQLTIWDPS
jgi:hypothetical protein